MEQKAVVKAKNAQFSYEKDSLVITDATFDIGAGDFIFVTGKSGSGKTTLIKSIYGATAPTTGELSVLDTSMIKLSKSKLSKLRREIGVVFQDYKLVDEWTIEKNIMLPLLISGYATDVCQKQVAKMLDYVKLSHKMDKYPKELSGGEQQRAGVARAIAHNPEIVIADEPTGNLDEYSAALVMDLFRKVNKVGTTVIIATHKIPDNYGATYRHFHIEEGVVNEIA